MSSMSVNFTVPDDFFAETFSCSYLNWSMLGIYLLGLVSCAGLGFASWFEKSGQAGPFRTVINQLVSFIFDQIILGYIGGYSIDNVRQVIGPIPPGICKIGIFFRVFVSVNISLLILSITSIKFFMICIRKSVPVMEDNFIAAIIFISINVNSFLATMSKFYIENKTSRMMAICSGTDQEQEPDQLSIPLAIIVGSVCAVGHICLSAGILYTKCKGRYSTPVQPFNHQATPITNFGSTCLSWTYTFLFAFQLVGLLVVELIDVEDLKTFPGQLALFNMTTLSPVFTFSSLVLIFYASKKHFRAAANRIFFPDISENQVHE